MKYTEFDEIDFILDESFQQYCSGTDPDSVTFWERWKLQHPEKEKQFQLAKRIYLSLNGKIDKEYFEMQKKKFENILRQKGILPAKE